MMILEKNDNAKYLRKDNLYIYNIEKSFENVVKKMIL
jgi:hypothetical protein